MAEIVPAADAPVGGQTGFADEGLEALCLADRRERWVPGGLKRRLPQETDSNSTLGIFQDTLDCADIGVNEIQLALQYRQGAGRLCFYGSGADKARGLFHRVAGDLISGDGEKCSRRLGIGSCSRIGLCIGCCSPQPEFMKFNGLRPSHLLGLQFSARGREERRQCLF